MVVEGAIDSMFVKNAVAMAGAEGNTKGLDNIENSIYVFDNEPRNKEIIKRMYSVVEKDYNVVIWPSEIQSKDVNDLILSGLTKAEVSDIISKNTYSKLSALTKLNDYKKV